MGSQCQTPVQSQIPRGTTSVEKPEIVGRVLIGKVKGGTGSEADPEKAAEQETTQIRSTTNLNLNPGQTMEIIRTTLEPGQKRATKGWGVGMNSLNNREEADSKLRHPSMANHHTPILTHFPNRIFSLNFASPATRSFPLHCWSSISHSKADCTGFTHLCQCANHRVTHLRMAHNVSHLSFPRLMQAVIITFCVTFSAPAFNWPLSAAISVCCLLARLLLQAPKDWAATIIDYMTPFVTPLLPKGGAFIPW